LVDFIESEDGEEITEIIFDEIYWFGGFNNRKIVFDK